MLGEMINSLWRSDALWPHRSRSTLAQAMACCLLVAKPLPEPMLTCPQLGPVTFT